MKEELNVNYCIFCSVERVEDKLKYYLWDMEPFWPQTTLVTDTTLVSANKTHVAS